MSLVTRIETNITSTLVTTGDLVNPTAPLAKKYSWDLLSGTGLNKAEDLFSDQRTLAASASEDLDLSGSLSNPLGTTLTFTKVKALIVRAAVGNTNNVLVGGAAANQVASFFGDVTDVVSVPPGGAFVLIAPDAAGFAITAGSADLLKIANSGAGTGVTYDIIIIGETS